MLTQLARVSEARHIELDEIAMRVSPQFSQEGSILADTVESRLLGIDTELEITTSAPRDVVSKLVATAERMCFMMGCGAGAARGPLACHGQWRSPGILANKGVAKAPEVSPAKADHSDMSPSREGLGLDAWATMHEGIDDDGTIP